MSDSDWNPGEHWEESSSATYAAYEGKELRLDWGNVDNGLSQYWIFR